MKPGAGLGQVWGDEDEITKITCPACKGSKHERCPICHGVRCRKCGGGGTVLLATPNTRQYRRVRCDCGGIVCKTCAGAGVVGPCGRCHGLGMIPASGVRRI